MYLDADPWMLSTGDLSALVLGDFFLETTWVFFFRAGDCDPVALSAILGPELSSLS